MERLDVTEFVKGRKLDNYKDFVTYVETKEEIYTDNDTGELELYRVGTIIEIPE